MLVVTEKGTHDSVCILREYRVCFAVQKMSQKETTRMITSSSDKPHQTEGEEMNEELLKWFFPAFDFTAHARSGFFPSETQNCCICQGDVAV